MTLTVGKEYLDLQIDFLSKQVTKETKLMYLGRHPYDNRHMFAMEPSGGAYAPDDGEFLGRLVEA